MESARTTLVRPLKLVAMDDTWMPVLLMKSLTCTPGDMPRSSWSSPWASVVRPVRGLTQLLLSVPTPLIESRASYAMTRANAVEILPPSPTKAWVKFPEFRAYVESPSPNEGRSTEMPRHADRITLRELRRTSSMRSVSVDVLANVAPISQNRWPNGRNPLVGLTSFSIRSVALPANGLVLLCVGVVE